MVRRATRQALHFSLFPSSLFPEEAGVVQLSRQVLFACIACIRIHSCCGCVMRRATCNGDDARRVRGERQKWRKSSGFRRFPRDSACMRSAHAALRCARSGRRYEYVCMMWFAWKRAPYHPLTPPDSSVCVGAERNANNASATNKRRLQERFFGEGTRDTQA